MYRSAFFDKTVLITGHTGFKGAWLSIYLKALGAQIVGYSLPAPTTPSIFEQACLQSTLDHIEGDIRDLQRLTQVMRQHQPDFVFHMAAQPIVIESYRNPVETYDVNVMGSVKLLEAIRQSGIRTTVIMVVTDKCYKNNEWVFGYRENDPLGGHDPYSASKAAMDIAVQSYRLSFFPPEKSHEHGVGIASVRSGNVIGGGDWAANRIVPDAARAFSHRQPLVVRNTHAVRPWQHVLEPLSGYLWLAACMSSQPQQYADDWNFGPLPTEGNSVGELADEMVKTWGDSAAWIAYSDSNHLHEAGLLRLNIDKAVSKLGWKPVWDFATTVQRTIAWYKQAQNADADTVYSLCTADIHAYQTDAREKGLAWIS